DRELQGSSAPEVTRAKSIRRGSPQGLLRVWPEAYLRIPGTPVGVEVPPGVVGEALLVAAVGSQDIDLVVAVSIAVEHETPGVGRPRGKLVHRRVTCETALIRAVARRFPSGDEICLPSGDQDGSMSSPSGVSPRSPLPSAATHVDLGAVATKMGEGDAVAVGRPAGVGVVSGCVP